MNKLTPVIRCTALNKSFQDGQNRVEVLNNVELAIMPGEQLAIVGASGSGKSTLLHILGSLDQPSRGEVEILGHKVQHLSEAARCRLRNETLGFIYQFHHLLAEFTALENVCMPLLMRRMTVKQATARAGEMLAKVGLAKRLHHRIGQLSGGERQRTAIARALVTQPRCILADEPTGNLDKQTAQQVYNVMLELNKEFGTSLVVVTHDMHLAEQMAKVSTMDNGCLLSR